MQDHDPKLIPIPSEVARQVMAYLQRRPYIEVAGIIQAMSAPVEAWGERERARHEEASGVAPPKLIQAKKDNG